MVWYAYGVITAVYHPDDDVPMSWHSSILRLTTYLADPPGRQV